MTDRRPPGPRDWKCDYSLDGATIHIRPRNDLIYHTPDDTCPCGTSDTHIDTPQARWISVHHPLDGRPHPPQRAYIPTAAPTGDIPGECGGIPA